MLLEAGTVHLIRRGQEDINLTSKEER